MLDKKEQKRFREAFKWSRRQLSPFIRDSRKALRLYVGHNYGDNGYSMSLPLNMLELFVTTYVTNLAAHRPRATVNTDHMELKRSAMFLEQGLNNLLTELNLEATLRQVLTQAFFGMSAVKIGLEDYGEVDIAGEKYPVGKPFVEPIMLDNWVHDMAANVWSDVTFMGNKYRVPLDVAKAMSTEKREIKPSEKQYRTEDGQETIDGLSVNQDTPDEMYEHVTLWDVWFPRTRMFATYPMDDEGNLLDPIRVEEDWGGPEHGPYHTLSLMRVPGNVMPLAPVSTMYDLAEALALTSHKVVNQLKRQKKNLLVMAGSEEDASRINQAADGQAIRIDNPDKAKEVMFGGVDQLTLVTMTQLKQIFTYMAGNLDSIGGLAAQTETAMQDRMLAASASKRVADMQHTYVEFVRGVVNDLGWYVFYDPLMSQRFTVEVPGTDYSLPVEFTSEDIGGDFLQYNYDIDPYSMQYKAPSDRLNSIMQVFGSVIAPMMPMMQQQGLIPNFEALLRAIAKYADMPEMEELVQYGSVSGIQPSGAPPSHGLPGGGGGTKTYERVVRPGASQQGQDATLMQLLAGGKPQPEEMSSMMQGGG